MNAQIRLDIARELLRLASPAQRGLRKMVLNTRTGRRTYWVQIPKLKPKTIEKEKVVKPITPYGRRVVGFNQLSGLDGYDSVEEMEKARKTYGYLYKSQRVPFVPKREDREGVASPVPYDRFPHLKVSEGYVPKKTKTVYRVGNVDSNGNIVPSMVKGRPARFGEWVDAEYFATKDLCPRPGYHAGVLPIQRKQRVGLGQDEHGEGWISPERVWIECEVPDDVDWNKLIEEESGGDFLQLKKRTTHGLTDETPRGGHYLMGQHGQDRGAEWVVAGQVNHVRVLGREEVRSLLKDAYEKQLASNGGKPLLKYDKKKKTMVSAGITERDIERELPSPKAIAAARAFEKGNPIADWNKGDKHGVDGKKYTTEDIMRLGNVSREEVDGKMK